MSSCNFTTQILDSDCIGDSRVTINNNFATLDTTACNQQSEIASLSAQVTILTHTPSASASPFAAKAWVNFAGRASVGYCTINRAYNVTSVYYTAKGQYDITFTTPFADANYAAIGTSTKWHCAIASNVQSATVLSIQVFDTNDGVLNNVGGSVVCYY